MQAARLHATRSTPNKFDAGDCDALSQNSIRCLEENNGDRSVNSPCQPHFEAYRECNKKLYAAKRAANASR